jgi:hypothetical protein
VRDRLLHTTRRLARKSTNALTLAGTSLENWSMIGAMETNPNATGMEKLRFSELRVERLYSASGSGVAGAALAKQSTPAEWNPARAQPHGVSSASLR